MLGYIVTERSELKVRELGTYNGYYCGLCKTIGRNYGQVLRKGLSYDMAFMALFLASLSESDDDIRLEHCAMHHIKKRPVLYEEPALVYAADMMMILGYENFLDDVRDGDKSKSSFTGKFLRKAYNQAAAAHGETGSAVRHSLEELYRRETEADRKIETKADYFGQVMARVFGDYAPAAGQKRVLEDFGDYLGRWIYVTDAMDDYVEDAAKHRYNPLNHEDDSRPREMVASGVEAVLYYYLGELTKAYDLLDIKKNKGIIDNVIYLGLRRKTDEVLSGKGTKENGKRSI
ncbi:DUF5685 family protein [Aminicella lysinilytica]|uniref:Uncharacterized protein n=1 Tax=Aminicella lysinilytica TaxID=433323 RepID=A0A4R6QCM7_9FIRM|nr:DUF5685 family protein [Aminicella lysinilytica]TDP59119.1 hypothetical protein EV211_10452 [Aminicella lysinilytica]